MARGAYTARKFAAELARSGETMTLRRPGGASVAVKGKRHQPKGATGDELVGMATQAMRRIIISNAEIAANAWPGPPKNGDLIIIDNKPYRLIDDANTQVHDGVIVAHFLTVKGGPG